MQNFIFWNLPLGKTVSLIVYYGNISHSLKIFLVLMRDGCHVSPWHVHILAFEGIVPKSGQPDSSPFICIWKIYLVQRWTSWGGDPGGPLYSICTLLQCQSYYLHSVTENNQTEVTTVPDLLYWKDPSQNVCNVNNFIFSRYREIKITPNIWVCCYRKRNKI